MTIATTDRTELRELTADDAPFILDLLNQPSFLRFIGDREVRNLEDAVDRIETRFRKSYRENGYGSWAVVLHDTGVAIGICGFVRRESLPMADLGFAFLPQYEGLGYAHEAAVATLAYGHRILGMSQVMAIAQLDNVRSHRLLARLGFQQTDTRTMPGDAVPVAVFTLDLSHASASMQSYGVALHGTRQ
jgi:[ribosomal protein S5]-alanine N-acetyltransferase